MLTLVEAGAWIGACILIFVTFSFLVHWCTSAVRPYTFSIPVENPQVLSGTEYLEESEFDVDHTIDH